MKIYSVFDPEFKPYGQIVTGLDETVQEILAALRTTPLPEGVGYVPTEPALQELLKPGIMSVDARRETGHTQGRQAATAWHGID